jgi:hypothetical protein
MTTMNMPGFAAEAALYHTSGRYHGSQVRTAAPQLVTPQLRCLVRLDCLEKPPACVVTQRAAGVVRHFRPMPGLLRYLAIIA